MSEEKKLNLSKKTIPELKELLERQKSLIENKKLLAHLKDKGEGAKVLFDKIKNEIQLRNDMKKIESSLSDLKISNDPLQVEVLKEKHINYVCSKEKPLKDTRYRPHRTLAHTKVCSAAKAPKNVEVTSAYEPYLIHQPTQFITLSESLVIQQEQARKVTVEQTKRFLQGFQEYNDDSESETEEAAILETEDDKI
ncbi:hypothetical protein FQA39_LY11535 [Lamprigera yunnana]|nr:hypothetical protein FQA39_LY11535 [Lamprigera yunnana]